MTICVGAAARPLAPRCGRAGAPGAAPLGCAAALREEPGVAAPGPVPAVGAGGDAGRAPDASRRRQRRRAAPVGTGGTGGSPRGAPVDPRFAPPRAAPTRAPAAASPGFRPARAAGASSTARTTIACPVSGPSTDTLVGGGFDLQRGTDAPLHYLAGGCTWKLESIGTTATFRQGQICTDTNDSGTRFTFTVVFGQLTVGTTRARSTSS